MTLIYNNNSKKKANNRLPLKIKVVITIIIRRIKFNFWCRILRILSISYSKIWIVKMTIIIIIWISNKIKMIIGYNNRDRSYTT